MEIYRYVKTSFSRFLKTCLQGCFCIFQLRLQVCHLPKYQMWKSIWKAFKKLLKRLASKERDFEKACHQMRWHKKTDFQNTFALIWWGKNGRKKHKDKLHPNNHSWTKFTNVAERLQRRCKWWRIFVLTISEFWVDSKYWRQDQD